VIPDKLCELRESVLPGRNIPIETAIPGGLPQDSLVDFQQRRLSATLLVLRTSRFNDGKKTVIRGGYGNLRQPDLPPAGAGYGGRALRGQRYVHQLA